MAKSFVPSDERMRQVLEDAKRIAVVGLSNKPDRPSYQVAAYLQAQGYEIIPVNPMVDEVLGQKAVASLKDVEGEIDIVDVFRRSEEVPAVVDEAIAVGAKALWLQLGVIHEEAAQKAADHGMDVIMDRCIKVEHARLFS
ncbi:MAG: CoA-binding protein [Bacillaceae bacterium G1]|nr:CoA-binding protein [Bacillota bacterium]OJF18049.1 MAG: CoA-binding protein [Bacillaceae bacterium G1]